LFKKTIRVVTSRHGMYVKVELDLHK
jgi:hypothetical protein